MNRIITGEELNTLHLSHPEDKKLLKGKKLYPPKNRYNVKSYIHTPERPSILLLGPPSVGKGTRITIFQGMYGLEFAIGTGDVFRKEIKKLPEDIPGKIEKTNERCIDELSPEAYNYLLSDIKEMLRVLDVSGIEHSNPDILISTWMSNAGKLVPGNIVANVYGTEIKREMDKIVCRNFKNEFGKEITINQLYHQEQYKKLTRPFNGMIGDGPIRTKDQVEPMVKIMEDNYAAPKLIFNINGPLSKIMPRLTLRKSCDECGATYNLSAAKNSELYPLNLGTDNNPDYRCKHDNTKLSVRSDDLKSGQNRIDEFIENNCETQEKLAENPNLELVMVSGFIAEYKDIKLSMQEALNGEENVWYRVVEAFK